MWSNFISNCTFLLETLNIKDFQTHSVPVCEQFDEFVEISEADAVAVDLFHKLVGTHFISSLMGLLPS